jgi:hypothetical protein
MRAAVLLAVGAIAAVPAARAAPLPYHASTVRAAFRDAGLPLRTTSAKRDVVALASRRAPGRGYDVIVFVFNGRSQALALLHKQSYEWRYSGASVKLVDNLIVLVFPLNHRPGVKSPPVPTPGPVARALAHLSG